MNYAAWLQTRLDDPATPREQYMKYWQEMQDLIQRQKTLDEQARQRHLARSPSRVVWFSGSIPFDLHVVDDFGNLVPTLTKQVNYSLGYCT